MKHRYVVLFALLIASTAAAAQGANEANPAKIDRRLSAVVPQYLNGTMGIEAHGRLAPTMSACAPDAAAPVWVGNGLLGYVCTPPSANGS